ncbi:MAG: DUF167 domain-containing protein [Pseudomonadota bacterium]
MANRKAVTPAKFSSIEGAAFIRIDKHGDIILDIQVIPNAARTQVDGLYGEGDQIALKIRLNAPPVDGKANDALIKWLASELGIARSSLEVVRGQTSRRKQLRMSAEAAANANWKQLTERL